MPEPLTLIRPRNVANRVGPGPGPPGRAKKQALRPAFGRIQVQLENQLQAK
jgi:hypothetical protein